MPKKKKTKKVKRAVSKTKKKSSTTRKPSSNKRPKASKKPTTDGKFKPGNTASKGATGPEIKHRLKLAEAFKSAVTVKDMKDIATALIKVAKKGNYKAAEVLMNRCLGKPIQPIAGDSDGGPIPLTIIDYRNIDDSK